MLDKLLGSSLRAKAIAWFFARPSERYFVRQLTKLLDVDSTNLSRELARLHRFGLLTSTTEGRQKYYQANHACPFFPELKGLVMKTSGLADVIRDELRASKARIHTAFIYGSFASGSETPESDVDLLVIGDASLRDLAPSLRRAGRALAREINPVVLTPSAFAADVRRRHHFITAVLKAPKLFLIGDDHDIKGLTRKRQYK
jgi:predicted nucleotidyltransferase